MTKIAIIGGLDHVGIPCIPVESRTRVYHLPPICAGPRIGCIGFTARRHPTVWLAWGKR